MKRAVMQMSAELLSQILIEGNEIHIKVENGLPEDAKFVSCSYTNFPKPTFSLIYDSEKFEDVPTDARLPRLKPAMFTRLDCDVEVA